MRNLQIAARGAGGALPHERDISHPEPHQHLRQIPFGHPLIPAHSASLRAFTPVFDGLWTRVDALLLPRGAPRGDERRSGGNSTLELSDDFDRTADCKPKIAVRATLVDRDFGEPVRILVPEGRARRAIAEGPCALEHAPRGGKLSVGRQRRRPQAGDGIAEMVDVDDFGEVVGPLPSAIRIVLARPASGRLAARQAATGANRSRP